MPSFSLSLSFCINMPLFHSLTHDICRNVILTENGNCEIIIFSFHSFDFLDNKQQFWYVTRLFTLHKHEARLFGYTRSANYLLYSLWVYAINKSILLHSLRFFDSFSFTHILVFILFSELQQMSIQFHELLTSTFEYPSESSFSEEINMSNGDDYGVNESDLMNNSSFLGNTPIGKCQLNLLFVQSTITAN